MARPRKHPLPTTAPTNGHDVETSAAAAAPRRSTLTEVDVMRTSSEAILSLDVPARRRVLDWLEGYVQSKQDA